ncbi:hypothetical protein NQZ68_029807, partial [Dissostichus eleginoides]
HIGMLTAVGVQGGSAPAHCSTAEDMTYLISAYLFCSTPMENYCATLMENYCTPLMEN